MGLPCQDASTLVAALQFDMASADGTQLWGHQKRLPNQPQLYLIELDLDHDECKQRPAGPPLAVQGSNRTGAASTAAVSTTCGALDPEVILEVNPEEQYTGQPQRTPARAARFSLLAPEYSSDMPVISKTCYGMLLSQAAYDLASSEMHACPCALHKSRLSEMWLQLTIGATDALPKKHPWKSGKSNPFNDCVVPLNAMCWYFDHRPISWCICSAKAAKHHQGPSAT